MDSTSPPSEQPVPTVSHQSRSRYDHDSLECGSFTAQKLKHASPDHLHITNRRFFIGPLPKGWGQHRRRHWYKSCLGIRDYSSRNQTFSADISVGYQRQLTRYMGSSSTTRFKPSFPQPDDVEAEDEDENDQTSPAMNGQTTGESSRGNHVGPKIIKSVEAGRQAQRQDDDTGGFGLSHPSIKRLQTQHRPKNSPIATNSSPVVRMSSDENVPEAYFTAPDAEPQSATPEANPLPRNSTTSQELRSPENDHLQSSSSLPYRNSYATTGASAVSTTDGVGLEAEVGSQSSLISHNKQQSSSISEDRRKSKTQQLELQRQEPRGESDQTEAELAKSQQPHRLINRVISDRVRFGVEERVESGQRRLQNRLGLSDDSRASRKQKRQTRRHGEVLRAEKMLVRIDVTAQTVPNLYNDNASVKIETRPIENWREYLVVCRQGYDEQTPYLLQFYKTRVIPQVQGAKVKRKYAHEVKLSQGQANVNLFSTLDKTVVVWHPTKMNGTRIFIMRARAAAHSVEWYTFIRKVLGWKQPSSLFVHAPDLDVSLVLQNPFERYAKDNTEESEGTLSNNTSEEQAVSTAIIRTCMNTLSDCSEWPEILDIWKKSENMGLAWRRYDRIEWIQGGNEERMYGTMAMRTSHDLELRPKRHYPTSTAMDSSEVLMEEPSPVEGFLILLTSQQGTHRRWGKNFSRRLYLYSEDQYLCFCKPTKASTPPAPKLPSTLGTGSSTAPETIRGSPVIYPVDPYPLEDGQIPWLRDGGNKSYANYCDQTAYAEDRRNTNNLGQAEGYFNLCRVSEIRTLSETESRGNQGNETSSGSQEPVRNHPTTGSFSLADQDHVFELQLDDGLVVRLRAYNTKTRDVWIHRLRQLTMYWKARVKADITTLKSVRQHNLEKLDIDEAQESIIGQFAQKWEVARADASPELFNVCGPSGCRAIKRSGYLYRKPRRRGSFAKCDVILAEGQLLIFQDSVRTFSGEQVPHTHQSKQNILDLRDCYLYSGVLTNADLLYHSQTFDNNHPGHNSTPRIYPSDGWTSADEDTATTFVIWNNTRRILFHGEEEGDGKQKKRKWRNVSRLGASGRSIVFKARSRAERDMWVLAIETEIDRLQQEEDMRIVPEK
ncbi:meiotically up-regulated 56 protein [Nannizzia gypsea CBS 118893]|uniref:Meiotically up-regulated 56 protein n=1 Tax=Arthroderma gypseum (strain ATCC MYA-4604 / CBS 118893) TaxID=535722 RepID=E5R137_ARTGP|nr:meiotically up-regulated 56 protein [Nannizzia gypsea CBS 118893]EFQ97641.1 meiotically up-regulated 56 protein [Nannizzia gypsea CBS 118893]